MFLNLNVLLFIYFLSTLSLFWAASDLTVRLQKSFKNPKLFIGLSNVVIFFILVSQISCSPKSNVEDNLIGSWLRSDGIYKIEITEVTKDGILEASYFNPNAINVGRAGWRMKDKKLQIFVELRDENYPGSLYQLDFDKKTKTLKGTYYQAVSKQTYDVMFEKVIN